MASQQEVAKTDLSAQSEILTPTSLNRRSYGCRTKGVANEVNFEWTIERFSYFDYCDEVMNSTEFDGKFSLSFRNSQNLLYIDLLSSTRLDYPILVETAIIKECKEISKRTSFFKADTEFPGRLLGVSKPPGFSGEFTISCKIESLNTRGRDTTTYRYFDETMFSDNYLLRQLEEMFEKMVLSDITFNIQGRTFPAHKTILAMRSPVFAAMFQHPTKEAESSQVEVEDIDPDVFQEILRFIYTGRTQSTAMDKMAPALLAAADKYLLEDLKSRCETHLIRQMSTENCLELLSLAIHHPVEHLKKCAVEYFRRFPDDFMKTDQWKKMREENPGELCDLQQMIISSAPTV